MSYLFQATLIDTMGQYAILAAEEHLNPGGANDEAGSASICKGRPTPNWPTRRFPRGRSMTWTSRR